jgi:hypothetical protein
MRRFRWTKRSASCEIRSAPARWIEQAPQGLERLEEGRGGEKHLNVVLVSVESLGAEFLGSYGDRRGLTPRLDRARA